MATETRTITDAFYAAVAAQDAAAIRALYTDAAQLVRFDGAATGVDEIVDFWTTTRLRHAPYELRSIDQYTESADVIMWDALVTTDRGILQTTEVLVIDDGKIARHIPGIRGYWGQ